MSHPTIEHQTCRKHGFILTCYVNGKKRFRAQASAKPSSRTSSSGLHRPFDGPSDRVNAAGL